MTFNEIMELILDLEGGDRIVDNPRDPGGLTKWGIALNSHPELGREGILKLTKAGAVKIYKSQYWTPGQCSKFPLWFRLAAMDGAVNHGVLGNAKLIQKAANRVNAKLAVDGIVGPKTIAAVKAIDIVPMLQAYLEIRLEFYRSLPTFEEFGRGWELRVLRIAIES